MAVRAGHTLRNLSHGSLTHDFKWPLARGAADNSFHSGPSPTILHGPLTYRPLPGLAQQSNDFCTRTLVPGSGLRSLSATHDATFTHAPRGQISRCAITLFVSVK